MIIGVLSVHSVYGELVRERSNLKNRFLFYFPVFACDVATNICIHHILI